MGLTVEGIGHQVPSQSNTALIRPEEANDMELSSLLSGSGSFKSTGNDEIGKYIAKKEDKKEEKKQKAKDLVLDALPSVLSAGVGYKVSGSKTILITCLVSNLVALGIKLFKNKKAATANA